MASPYSIIPIIICVIVTLFVVSFISAPCSKPNGKRNKVHYYVAKDWSHTDLWLGKPEWNKMLGVWYAGESNNAVVVCHGYSFDDYKLDLGDFLDMENGEIREVFLNMED